MPKKITKILTISIVVLAIGFRIYLAKTTKKTEPMVAADAVVASPELSEEQTTEANALAAESGYGLNFNGKQSLKIPHSSALNVQTGAFAIDFWLKPNSSSAGYNGIISKSGYVSPKDGVTIFFEDGSNRIYFQIGDGKTQAVLLSNSIFAAGSWWHVVCQRRADGSLEIYRNSVLDSAPGAIYTSSPDNIHDLYFAQWSDVVNPNQSNIKIDEVRWYNKELSQAEIATHYNGGKANRGMAETGLQGGWHFSENAGTTAADYSGNNLTGELEDGATWSAGKN